MSAAEEVRRRLAALPPEVQDSRTLLKGTTKRWQKEIGTTTQNVNAALRRAGYMTCQRKPVLGCASCGKQSNLRTPDSPFCLPCASRVTLRCVSCGREFTRRLSEVKARSLNPAYTGTRGFLCKRGCYIEQAAIAIRAAYPDGGYTSRQFWDVIRERWPGSHTGGHFARRTVEAYMQGSPT